MGGCWGRIQNIILWRCGVYMDGEELEVEGGGEREGGRPVSISSSHSVQLVLPATLIREWGA